MRALKTKLEMKLVKVFILLLTNLIVNLGLYQLPASQIISPQQKANQNFFAGGLVII